MKIVGFAQLRNEHVKGNLHNWFRCMMEVCDKIYIFDQASDDGSLHLYRQLGEGKTYVLASQINQFANEVGCKSVLLKTIQEKEPDTNFLYWMDGDTILDKRLLNYNKIREVLSEYPEDVDTLMMGHRNLWRSDTYYRTDDSYDGLNGGVSAFWRFSNNLHFPESGGLHQRVIPLGLKKAQRMDPLYTLIHKGFATDYQIITKYETYKARGQSGWALERLLNEEGLTVEEIDLNILPDWYTIRKNNDPRSKQKIREIYNELHGRV